MSFWQVFWLITHNLFANLHNLVYLLFIISLFRLFLAKFAPYAAFYIASVAFTQAVYDGCSLVDIENFLASKASQQFVPNDFWAGIFATQGQWEILPRIFVLIISGLLWYYSFKTWHKVDCLVDFRRIFKRIDKNYS